MKILLACQQSPHTYAIPAYRFWRTYFVEGLREAGHEIVEVPAADWARGLTPLSRDELARWREETWTRTLETLRATPGIDLFVGYLYPQQIEPAAIRTLQSAGVPAVNFFCDNLREYRRLPEAFAPFDLHWVPESGALPLYAARPWKVIHLPMPCWVPPTRRQLVDQDERFLTFVGRADPLRRDLLAPVARAHLPLQIFGSGWNDATGTCHDHRPTWTSRLDNWCDFIARQGLRAAWRRLRGAITPHTQLPSFDFGSTVRGPADDDAYPYILARSAVTLGINRCPAVHGEQLVYSRLRDIEAPMLGACYLTEWAPELPDLYDLGREMETYRTADELIEKARALLADPSRRRALRLAGQRRALADHNVGRSVALIAETLGLSRVP